MTPEEIAQQAAQREAEEQADFERRMREKEREMGINDDDDNEEYFDEKDVDEDEGPATGGAEAGELWVSDGMTRMLARLTNIAKESKQITLKPIITTITQDFACKLQIIGDGNLWN